MIGVSDLTNQTEKKNAHMLHNFNMLERNSKFGCLVFCKRCLFINFLTLIIYVVKLTTSETKSSGSRDILATALDASFPINAL